MGLLDRINELGLKDNSKVTILGIDNYVIFEEKLEQCEGLYKVHDLHGEEVLYRATTLTSQKIKTVAELKELAKGFVIDNNCQIPCSGTTASGSMSTAIGQGTTASGNYSTAIGFETIASGLVSFSEGSGTLASGDYSVAMGRETTASGQNSTAMGNQTTAIRK